MKTTDTEIIAMKLFGWEIYGPSKSINDEPSMDYRHKETGEYAYVLSVNGEYYGPQALNWPNLQDWNWIRRIEDKLAETLRNGAEWYGLVLTRVVKAEEDPERLEMTGGNKVSWNSCLRATTVQRVSAALRVIQEAGL